MALLIPGQKIGLPEADQPMQLLVNMQFSSGEADITCFGVDASGKLSDDRYFVFYNQLSTPEGAIRKSPDDDKFLLELNRLPLQIEKLVFTAAIDSSSVMSDLRQGSFRIDASGEAIAECEIDGAVFCNEKAVILCELYRRNGQWRLSVVCKGFDGGLSALLKHFGGEEETSPSTQSAQPSSQPKVSLSKGEAVQSAVMQKAPRLVELTKKAVITLEKKKLSDICASVVLVLDASGSMVKQYDKGRVQRLLDKVLPLALLFDDDGTLDVWAFASKHRQLTEAALENIGSYVDQADGGWKRWKLGFGNNEPPVMEEIYSVYKDSDQPVYILFISDGGIYKDQQIESIIKKAAYGPLFWQFVGIGGKKYGILEKLDTMEGRVVDNASFFSLDDIDSISDEELYDRLMNEFPSWIEAAKRQHIL